MSDEPKSESTPPEPTPAPRDDSTAPEAPASPSVVPPGGTKEGAPSTSPAPTPSRPPIDYAMPTQKKSWLPTPAMIRNIGCILKMMVGFTVLLCMGYFALMAMNPKARQWALQGSQPGPGGAPASGKGPTPFKAVNQILAIPAQALGKTDDVVKANNARVGTLDGVIKEEEGKTKGGTAGRTLAPVTDPFAKSGTADPQKKPASGSSAPEKTDGPASVSRNTLLALAEKQQAEAAASTPESAPAPEAKASPSVASAKEGDSPSELKLPGGVVISQASPAGAPRASRAFFYWVVSLNISGITQGSRARLLINNRLAYEGDEVNRNLGVTFAQLDAANKLLVFRDQSGATVTRSY